MKSIFAADVWFDSIDCDPEQLLDSPLSQDHPNVRCIAIEFIEDNPAPVPPNYPPSAPFRPAAKKTEDSPPKKGRWRLRYKRMAAPEAV